MTDYGGRAPSEFRKRRSGYEGQNFQKSIGCAVPDDRAFGRVCLYRLRRENGGLGGSAVESTASDSVSDSSPGQSDENPGESDTQGSGESDSGENSSENPGGSDGNWTGNY